MNVHIRREVEFENIIAEDWTGSISLTRQRLNVQQLLDSGDSDAQLPARLVEYLTSMDTTIEHLSKTRSKLLLKQPLFEWTIDDQVISTPCWRIETIVPRVLLASLCLEDAIVHVGNGLYKEAHHSLTSVVSTHSKAIQHLKCWSWKLPEMDNCVLHEKWHMSQMYYVTGLQNLCLMSVAIGKNSSSTVLGTIAERATRFLALSARSWPHSEHCDALLRSVDALRHYFSSNVLWETENYGQSIYRLENWCRGPCDFGPFQTLQDEWDKVPLLLHERNQVNLSVYFETVSAPTPLTLALDLTCTEASNTRAPTEMCPVEAPLGNRVPEDI